MRVTQQQGDLRAHAVAGTRVIMVALDVAAAKRSGLMGFAFKRQKVGGPAEDWLKGLKVFNRNEPNPQPKTLYSTHDNPIQSFLWSDYTADPDTAYEVTVAAMYGAPGALQQRDTLTLKIRTEKADDGKHGIWFNRGSVASQAFAREFNDAQMTDAIANDPTNKMTVWLSRGLLEACLAYIDGTPRGDGLRVCAYEFTYPPIFTALKNALGRGVDVQIVYHKTSENDRAIAAAGLTDHHGGTQVLFERTKTKIPHNKFIVRLANSRDPVSVWTGSTNFTASGFLGQTNVGHLITDSGTAKTYLDFWTALSGDPAHADAIKLVESLTPDPRNVIDTMPVTTVFSPRRDDNMLAWYAARIADAKTSVAFTGAFGVDATIFGGLAKHTGAVRFILLEKAPTQDEVTSEEANRDELLISYGAVLGQTYESKTGAGGRKLVPIPKFKLDNWFLKEELARQGQPGFVFFIHTKFLLVDPLSDDPLVCTGSANFSSGSLKANDENMVLIRGDTRVADIYLTEFDRIFRHFYFRDVANSVAVKGGSSDTIFLADTDRWTDQYFDPAKFNDHRREMFFADPSQSWTAQAKTDPAIAGTGTSRRRRQSADGAPATPKRRASPKGSGSTKRRSGAKRAGAKPTGAKRASPKRTHVAKPTTARKRVKANPRTKPRKTPKSAAARKAAPRKTGRS
jgi:phosphatidylserine/phosphatidylglycerophosphate/cardiolipin synthase-like enzyme